MQKCPDTSNGKHLFTEEYLVESEDINKTNRRTNIFGCNESYDYDLLITYYPKCELCELIDTRKKPQTRIDKGRHSGGSGFGAYYD